MCILREIPGERKRELPVTTVMSGPSATLDLYSSGDAAAGGIGAPHDDDVVLEGTLSSAPPGAPSSGPSSSGAPGRPGFNTLDEPIRDTILRDVRAVGRKFMHVLYPVEKKSLLRVSKVTGWRFARGPKLLLSFIQEWDLWGPLILCTFMATVLQGHDTNAGHKDGSGDGGPEFAEVFVIVWVGALVVTLNTKLLGGNISFFQVGK